MLSDQLDLPFADLPTFTPVNLLHPSPPGRSMPTPDHDALAPGAFPKLSLEAIEARVTAVHYVNLGDAVERISHNACEREFVVTLASVVLDNGFVLVGQSAPMYRENYNRERGQEFAYAQAIQQAWALFGFAHMETVHQVGLIAAQMAATDAAIP